MIDLASVYTPNLYVTEQRTSEAAAKSLLPQIVARYAPRSLIDVGCGVGMWCKVAVGLGLDVVVGIDGPWAPFAKVDGATFIEMDLEDPLPQGSFDVALCIEVPEHLSADRGPSLVTELCEIAPYVVWSAAPPGQGGEGHINERSPEYWDGLFAGLGYGELAWLGKAAKADSSIAPWLRSNLKLYAREPQQGDPRWMRKFLP